MISVFVRNLQIGSLMLTVGWQDVVAHPNPPLTGYRQDPDKKIHKMVFNFSKFRTVKLEMTIEYVNPENGEVYISILNRSTYNVECAGGPDYRYVRYDGSSLVRIVHPYPIDITYPTLCSLITGKKKPKSETGVQL